MNITYLSSTRFWCIKLCVGFGELAISLFRNLFLLLLYCFVIFVLRYYYCVTNKDFRWQVTSRIYKYRDATTVAGLADLIVQLMQRSLELQMRPAIVSCISNVYN